MKNNNYNLLLFLLLFTLLFASCREEYWDSHFHSGVIEKSDKNLYDFIKSDDSLSVFTRMIQIAGYDSILNQPQTFTVWAPVNSDSLRAILDSNDSVSIKRIVENHIAYYSFPTSRIDTSTIYMTDKKLIFFTKKNNDYYFGDERLIRSNIAVRNGVLHYLEGYVPYRNTFWEYVKATPGLELLRDFFNSNDTLIFDKTNSKQIGYDTSNRPVYDSIFIKNNMVLNQLAALDQEDSIYTAILPTNAAWTDAFDRIKGYYVTLPKDGGEALQTTNTSWAIVQDIVFRKRINPLIISGDSLVSTWNNVFQSPTYLFDNAKKVELSNGYAYITDLLKFKATQSWHKEIRIEAENTKYGRTNENCDVFEKNSLGTSMTTSKNKYIQLEPNTTSSLSKVAGVFPIPNTLSAKYNIYCVFVPTSILLPTDLKPSKVKFFLTYVDASGKETAKAPVVAVNGVNQVKVGGTASIFQTDPLNITKMFVAPFQFPICNLYTNKSTAANIYVKLRVENATTSGETVNFNRTMRIDCIILEPVE
jgi:hypothetical protein